MNKGPEISKRKRMCRDDLMIKQRSNERCGQTIKMGV